MRALMPIEAPRYGSYLQRVLALFEAIETELWSACGSLVPDRAARFKVPWLREDLAALGLAHETRMRASSTAPADPLEALGAAYVIEGSTLGGPVLLARLRASGLLTGRDARGARFLSGYGPENAAMWRAFRSALRHATCDVERWPALRRGALAMFQAYESTVAQVGPR